MGAIQAVSTILLLVTGAVFLVPAMGLLWWGVWPRRRGSDPHCRGCGYNLTGLEPGQCPECGEAWTTETVVVGERHRRPGVIIGGIACAAIMVAALAMPTYEFVRTFDPNFFKMTSTLLADMRSTNGLVAGRACAEVERRLGSWRTSRGQMEQFVGMVWQWKLEVRPRCVVSDGVPYELTKRQTGIVPVRLIPGVRGGYREDWTGISTRVIFSRYWWDNNEAAESTYHASDSHATINRGMAALGPGRHTLHHWMRMLYRRPDTPGDAGDLFEQDMHFEASCDVLETEPAGYMTVVRGALVGDAFRKVISPAELILVPGSHGLILGSIYYGINLKGPAPEEAAFEVIASIDGKEYPIGEVRCHKGQTQWHGQNTFYQRYTGPGATSADLILRGSEKLARESLDMFGTWEGDIVFQNVPVVTR